MNRMAELRDLCKEFNKGNKYIRWTDIIRVLLSLNEAEQLEITSIIETHRIIPDESGV